MNVMFMDNYSLTLRGYNYVVKVTFKYDVLSSYEHRNTLDIHQVVFYYTEII